MAIYPNTLLLLLHVLVVSSLTLVFLRLGKECIVAWLSFLAIALNFFVMKQINLFGFDVTCSDALVVGYLLGLNLIQEFFNKELARKTVWVSFFISLAFVVLSQIHLLYLPNVYDCTHVHYAALLNPMPRLLFASLSTFLVVQFFDMTFFAFLRKKTQGKFLMLRTAVALVFSQCLDTCLFSYLGLYGLIDNLLHVIVFSLLIKIGVILLSTPFIHFSKHLMGKKHAI